MSKTRSLSLWILAFIVIGGLIGWISQDQTNTWYTTLNRSPLTPPNYVFSIVWTILYAMLATCGWMIWNQNIKSLKQLFILQLVLNWAWTPLFFQFHCILLALICLSLITLLVGTLIIKCLEPLRQVSILLLPYFIWLCFAAYLNFYIWQYN